MLKDIIDECQSTFILGRSTIDNVITGHKSLHYLSNHKRGKTRYATLKLDMSKTHDRVEWSYLHQVMIKLSFHPRWTNLIMCCISSATFFCFDKYGI